MDRIDWTLWRTFLAVAEEGGLSQAARKLGLTQPTVGRHIDQLEAALGAALFTRSQTGAAPTATARALIPDARAMAASAGALTRGAGAVQGERRGVVRITASEVVGAEILPEALAAYRAGHPGVEIELALTDRTEDIVNRAADIAVRMTRPTQQRLLAKRLGTVAGGFYAARSYVNRRGSPASLNDLVDFDLIGPDEANFQVEIQGERLTARDFAFRTSSSLAQIAAIRSGVGIGAAQIAICGGDDRLMRVLPEVEAFRLELWLTMHEGLKTDPVIRSVFDFLAARLYKPSDR